MKRANLTLLIALVLSACGGVRQYVTIAPYETSVLIDGVTIEQQVDAEVYLMELRLEPEPERMERLRGLLDRWTAEVPEGKGGEIRDLELERVLLIVLQKQLIEGQAAAALPDLVDLQRGYEHWSPEAAFFTERTEEVQRAMTRGMLDMVKDPKQAPARLSWMMVHLAFLDKEQIIETAVTLLGHPSEEVRASAVGALQVFRARQFTESLQALSEDESETVRELVRDVLQQWTAGETPRLPAGAESAETGPVEADSMEAEPAEGTPVESSAL
jgi:hypothetical protein